MTPAGEASEHGGEGNERKNYAPSPPRTVQPFYSVQGLSSPLLADVALFQIIFSHFLDAVPSETTITTVLPEFLYTPPQFCFKSPSSSLLFSLPLLSFPLESSSRLSSLSDLIHAPLSLCCALAFVDTPLLTGLPILLKPLETIDQFSNSHLTDVPNNDQNVVVVVANDAKTWYVLGLIIQKPRYTILNAFVRLCFKVRRSVRTGVLKNDLAPPLNLAQRPRRLAGHDHASIIHDYLLRTRNLKLSRGISRIPRKAVDKKIRRLNTFRDITSPRFPTSLMKFCYSALEFAHVLLTSYTLEDMAAPGTPLIKPAPHHPAASL
ncbi:hypothetical protein ONZ45_g6341 [Pleurotus djamor]|nr:hypothetical protein ONZ45_g6341 [Pleurotus djamor]